MKHNLSALCLLILTLLLSCSKEKTAYVDPAFGEHIFTYTSGIVESTSKIQIVLMSDYADSTMIGEEATTKLFDFSPSINGKTVWLSSRTIEFRPEQRLPNGQVYEVRFLLSKLMKVKSELSEFPFSFQVIPQNFEVTFDNTKPYVKTELTRQRIEGNLTTADFADNAAVEKILLAKQDGRGLKISWTHNPNGKGHQFIIEDVTRKEEASAVKVAVDGSSINVSKQMEQEVEIPSLSDFKLITSYVVQGTNQYVVLRFSDPLKEKQNLAGLITIADATDTSLDFDIHDNEIWVYPPSRMAGVKTLRISTGIRNIKDFRMKTEASADVQFEQIKPEVRFTTNGNILPSTDGLVLPFEAVNLKSVDVSISQVFENNMLQFMQVNDISGSYEMRRVARPIVKKTISLENSGVTDFGKWNRFTLDLAKFVNAAPGNIYTVKVSFKKQYSAYLCDDESTETETEVSDFDNDDSYSGGYYGEDGEYYDDYYMPGYDWDQRENPCHVSYYTRSRQISKNVLASDLGLMAKGGTDGENIIFVNDLKTTQPLQGIQVEFYDYQQQLLGSANTDTDGKASFQSKERPFAVIAKSGAQRGYLRLNDGESLSMSGFDVSGEQINKGLKGFLYGDRGVWRPGDSLYLNFILEDKSKTLPPNHPVVFELQSPQGVVTNRQVKSSSENGFYFFGTATNPDAPTGNWTAKVKVGGTDFTQNIKIETVKPNRLKINLDFGVERIMKPDLTGNLTVKWLHGATAKNLKAEFEYSLQSVGTYFKNYSDYTFEDASREFSTVTNTAFEGQTDGEGKATFSLNLADASKNAPGFMNVVFKGKVFEEGGNFSIDRFNLPYSPYATYVGFKLATTERYTGMVYTDTAQRVDVVTVDGDGKSVDTELEAKIYKLDRYWWWDSYDRNLASYIERNTSDLITTGNIRTVNGKGSWNFRLEDEGWGTYYIMFSDKNGGHAAGRTFYADRPGYYGRYAREAKTGVTKLNFNTDKQAYNTGEQVKVALPGSEGGRALISIENGRKVISTKWFDTKKGENTYQFEATPEMSPNVFVHITLLQPHAQTSNDLPIRMYGIMPIGVEDANTHLNPIITMPDELEPGGNVKIVVSEKSKRKMTYTLAVVDEGLLDITRYKTPEPWNRFYAREALGVLTWDLYDRVMGAFGSRIERLLAIGGGDEAMKSADDPRANRFKPVVKFFGPITIDAGETSTLNFTMPQYIGSVKAMLVAGDNGAYGNTEKAVPVRKPLMVLATLPRVLGPAEKVKLPITVFADKKIKNIKVEVKASGPLTVSEPTKNFTIPSSGDMTIEFNVDVREEVGIGKVKVIATSGNFTGIDEIEIDVRNPNLPITQVKDQVVDAGQSWEYEVTPFGMANTNSAQLEVSTAPPINLNERLRYLIVYPHGCIEQTTSAAFPQLYLDILKELSDREKSNIKRNINFAINRLKSFITPDGGFGYWPGYRDSSPWGSTYAGHFLLEAEARGYFVPGEMLNRWKRYQKNKANDWRSTQYREYLSDFDQAYRLYTLAMAGAPELPAMNRLRETKDISLQCSWMLAAAYAKAGQPEVAKKLVANIATTVKPYLELDYTYGSDWRDKAIILETLTLLNDRTKAMPVLKEIAASLSRYDYWMSTQTTAYCLKAVAVFMGSQKFGQVKYNYKFDGKDVNASTELPISTNSLPLTKTKPGKVSITNQSTGPLFVRVSVTGTPSPTQMAKTEESKELFLSVAYTTMKGLTIDPSTLEQGTEFLAKVTVKSAGYRSAYRNLALTQIFPSGWEINNARLTNDEGLDSYDRGDYQDIRDDRQYTYFSLYSNRERTFTVRLTASFAGQFYMPAVSCEAMYDNSIYGRTTGQKVEVVKGAVE